MNSEPDINKHLAKNKNDINFWLDNITEEIDDLYFDITKPMEGYENHIYHREFLCDPYLTSRIQDLHQCISNYVRGIKACMKSQKK